MAPVGIGGQMIGVDDRRDIRIGRAYPDMALAVGPHIIGDDGHAGIGVESHRPLVVRVKGIEAHADLRVGPVERGIGLDEAAHFMRRMGQRTFRSESIAQSRHDEAQAGQFLVQAVPPNPVVEAQIAMFAKVGADAGRIDDDRDAERFEQGAGTDARQLQQLGALHRACGEDDLLPCRDLMHAILVAQQDAARPLPVEQDAQDVGTRRDVQIRPPTHGLQKSAGSGEALAAKGGCRLIGHAALGHGRHIVHVIHPLRPGLLGGGQEGFAKRVAGRVDADLERAAGAAPRLGAQHMVLQRDEMLAHPLPTPAGAACRFPAVVIGRSAPDIDHAVDRTGPTHRAALQPYFLGCVPAGRNGVIPHMGIARRQQLADAAGHGDQRAAVVRSRLHQQNPDGRVGRQTIGQHAAGRTRSHDDIVIAISRHIRSFVGHAAMEQQCWPWMTCRTAGWRCRR